MELQIHTAPQTDEAKLLGGLIPSILFSRPSLCVITAVLSGVDFWGRKCVKNLASPSFVLSAPGGRNMGRDVFHALSVSQIYTAEYV